VAPALSAPHDDRLGLGDLARKLLERVGEQPDVIGGIVGARVARPEHAGQRLAPGALVGTVEVGQQRMKAEAALIGAGRAVFVGVRGDQRRVDVDDQRPGGPGAQRERPLARRCPGRPERVEQAVLADPVDDPPRGGVGGDRSEQRALVAQGAQVAQRVAAVGQHDRQIAHHPARVMPAAAPAQRGQPGRQRPREPQPIGALGQQRRPGVTDRVLVSVRPNFYGELAAIALHPQGDPPEPGSRASATRKLPAQPDRTSAPASAGAPASCKIRARGTASCRSAVWATGTDPA